MSNSKLTLIPVTEEDNWGNLVSSSPQGSLFCERFYLDAAGCKYHSYFIKQGTGIENKAGVVVVVSEDGKNCKLDELVIYGGILFDLDPKRQKVKLRYDEFQTVEFAIEQLSQIYESVEFQLSPEFIDMRPFQWHRYHDEERYKFVLNLRYTSLVDISSLQDFKGEEESSPCFENMETVRRYSVRQARKKGGRIVKADSGDQLVEYYRSLMERQNESQASIKLLNMKNIINALLKAGRGAVYHVLNSDGEVIYSVCYGWDIKRAYYLFGAGHPEINEPWQGTLAHWEAFKDVAHRLGLKEVDLEGVNSPQRGWFKLGFGGNLTPYYHVSNKNF
jgi:hypothetical protein